MRPDQSAKVALQLVREFGSLDRVLAATPESLHRTLGSATAVGALLAAVRSALIHVLRARLSADPIISGSKALFDYLKLSHGTPRLENVSVLFLDAKNRLLRHEEVVRGSVCEAQLYPRLTLKRALELDAAGLILIHNHPSGDPTPSKADLRMTGSMTAAAAVLEITILDHVIVASSGIRSFRALGLL